jgi:hypothetical protein
VGFLAFFGGFIGRFFGGFFIANSESQWSNILIVDFKNITYLSQNAFIKS